MSGLDILCSVGMLAIILWLASLKPEQHTNERWSAAIAGLVILGAIMGGGNGSQ